MKIHREFIGPGKYSHWVSVSHTDRLELITNHTMLNPEQLKHVVSIHKRKIEELIKSEWYKNQLNLC